MSEETKDSKLATKYNFDVAWEELLDNKDFLKVFLSDVLENYIIKQRWYGGKSSEIKYIELAEYFRIQQNNEVYFGLILEVDFVEAFYHHYFIPIAFVTDENFSKKDRIIPYEDAQLFANRFKNSELITTKGFGHSLIDESLTPKIIEYINS